MLKQTPETSLWSHQANNLLALIFLEINDLPLNATDDELIELTMRTAQSQTSKNEIAAFYRAHFAAR